MSRHQRRLVAACLLAVMCGGLSVPSQAAPGPSRAEPPKDPLSVTIDAMSPSVITGPRERGRIRLRGHVRNDSDQPWTDLVAYIVPGVAPIRTQDELSAAVDSDPLTPFGSRLVEDGLYTRLPNLAPGQTAPYRLSVPIQALNLDGGRGVYWLGVHILGTSLEGRIDGADGRARTFLPLMRDTASPAAIDLIVPFRQKVSRAPDGRVLSVRSWQRRLGPGGRLANLLRFADSSTLPLSLLVDPAVAEAAASLAQGNPTYDGEPTSDPDRAAADWLRSLKSRARFSDLLTLPYGDVDTAAALDSDQTDVLDQASEVSLAQFPEEVPSSVVAPLTGYLSAAQLKKLGAGHTALLDPAALPDAEGPTLATNVGPQVVISDPLLARQLSAVDSLAEFRQLLLARLAVRSLSGVGDIPIVLALPPSWNPGANATGFFAGMDAPWVRGVGLPEVRAAVATEPYDVSSIAEPDGVDDAEVPISNFLAATDLTHHGELLAVLLGESGVAPVLTRQSLLAVSEHVRPDPKRARNRVNRTSDSIDATLAKVTLSGPSFVTLSSDSGTFQVTVSNELDQDVTIGIVGNSGTKQLHVKAPGPVTVPAGQRRSIRVTATARRLGVFRVTIRATTEDGQLLPGEIVLSVRSSEVGRVLWLVFGAAGGILFLAIGLRIARRIRRRRRDRG